MSTMSKDLTRNKIHPKKFALYLAFAASLMSFAGLTSAYIVRKAAGNWLEFKLPSAFFISTAIILLSSLTLHWAKISFANGKEKNYKLALVLSLMLGFGFMASQYIGWQQLAAIGVDLKGNPAGSFVYALSIFHIIHVLGGIGAIILAVLHAFSLKYRVTPERKLRLDLTCQYWHFVDIVWIYLLVFLMM
jgi:cytochrome c oxidase subunit III